MIHKTCTSFEFYIQLFNILVITYEVNVELSPFVKKECVIVAC